MTVRTKIIIAKCLIFPICLIFMPIAFIVGGIRGVNEAWKMFIEIDEEELKEGK